MSHLSQITHFADQPNGGFQTYHRTQDYIAPLVGFVSVPLNVPVPDPNDEEPIP